ncbi:Phosphoglucosamine mutase [Pirellula sp. SH-Sr6A]|uniref:phosphoglucosamine mutase n=1 Tax=Pirellula sp. SH-Sr6A TaxID=1632865 RepID=UPI00078D289D|nr:phosphoglucosamine mutase [Pirellula sp. SH-Sr6A]AMV31415.1 Phosphoglucosamine mutase [Pirellula sp. SH-Sr6A]
MAEPIISISGLRGIIGSELTPAVASRFAAAMCVSAGPGPIVLARDGRVSGPMLVDAIAATIVAHGRECIDVGIASTPTAGRNVRFFQAAGGIQVSASHNPPPYNGMKLFGKDGRVLSSGPGKRVLEAYQEMRSGWVGVESLGKRICVPDPHQDHLDAVLATVDVDAIRKRSFRVLLDANHGCGSILGERLLEALGCRAIILGAPANGHFAHPPEPLAENLGEIAEKVRESGCEVGFCQDPDADRLALIDEQGRYIGEEFTAVLCAYRRLMKSPGPIVTNCASSGMTKWLARRFDVASFQSAVGEANVADCMIEQGAVYGGEGSGGPIDPQVGYIRDSFVGMAQVLDLMAATGKSISEIAGEFPPSVMIKDKMSLSKERLLESLKRLVEGLECECVSQLDGVRLDWEDRWLLLRASNTEPIVRLIAEAPTRRDAESLITRAQSLIDA